MTKKRNRAYSNTTVAVSKSREDIDKILVRWGVTGIQWEDNFEDGMAQLRFRWKRPESGVELVARFRIEVDSEEELKSKAVDQRSGRFSEKKYEREALGRGKREHRILMNLLKNMFEAIEEGIIPPEAVLLPWLEDASGQTVYEKIEPRLDMLASSTLNKALGPSND